jgi:hypothetical protein
MKKLFGAALFLSLAGVGGLALADGPGGPHGGGPGCHQGDKACDVQGGCDGHPGPGRFFEAMDADKNGEVTLAEHQAAAKARFEEADADKNGKVTRDEFKAAKHARMGKPHEGGHHGHHGAHGDDCPCHGDKAASAPAKAPAKAKN